MLSATAATLAMGALSGPYPLAGALLGSGPPPLSRRPNLILYFPDELRADALACYGNPVVRTPNFDALAKRGTRFAECHVQNPVCAQSRCSMLTGWPTSVRGHRSLFYLLRQSEPNMFRYLKNAGYDIFWFGKNDALAPESFADSVTEWADAPRTGPSVLMGARPAGPLTMLMPGGGDRRANSDYLTLQNAIHILERKEQDRPFCIFLPLFQPHPPYRAPDGFAGTYKANAIPALVPPNLPKKPNFHRGIRKEYGLDAVDDATMRQVRATYYDQVAYTDWLLGEMLEALERTGHAQDTALFVSSDHGDYAGDYGLVEKWPSGLESCLTHVPLIAQVPGGASGHVVEEMTELFDIMPTFLDLAGTRATHTHFARNLTAQLQGAAGDARRAAFSEGGYNIYEPQAFEPPRGGVYAGKGALQNNDPAMISRDASIKTRHYTYISRPAGQDELYDRRNDPGEARNLIDESGMASVRADMQRRLLNWYINTSGVPDEHRDERGTPEFIPNPIFPDALTRSTQLLDGM
ncbi:hypothetical protein GCM10009087_11670 [Sphingomonas oligophenolica]